MDHIHENQRDQDISRYLKDIETIKDLLFKAERKPLYEHWASLSLFSRSIIEIFLSLTGNLIVLCFIFILFIKLNAVHIEHNSLSLIIGLMIGCSLITAGFTAGRIEKKGK